MLKESGFPGMKVLEFAFDDSENSDYLLINTRKTVLCIQEPMINETLVGWYENMNRRNKSFAREYMGCRHTPKKGDALGVHPPGYGKSGKAGSDTGSGLSGTWGRGPDQ